jgi:hypothetical protein
MNAVQSRRDGARKSGPPRSVIARRMDIAVSNFIDETSALYRNDGDMFFEDTTI